MWRPNQARSTPNPDGHAPFRRRRDRLAVLVAMIAAICLGAGLIVSKGTQVLMPGPLASVHGAIETCSTCHTTTGSGKLSWLHGLMGGAGHADSKACLTCHKMPDTAFNAHGASRDVLNQSTARLAKIATSIPAPFSARAESAALPAHNSTGGLPCATCHQEHKGVTANLSTISNEQCRSCHTVKFDSFDGRHPKFEGYPFGRRTRIIYDHAGHFGKHYPELAKKDLAKRIPETCATCHSSYDDKRIMAVAPFDQTCAGCHLDQIVGKERATGPKGVAFLSLPGIDVKTLRQKQAAIGEWPEDSDAELTPFMKVMIGRSAKGRDLLKSIDGLNLQDLSGVSDDKIEAVTTLVLEVKRLFHALIAGKASDVLGNLGITEVGTLSAGLVADLTASIPRDVIASAHKDWLPNLAEEIAQGPRARDPTKKNEGDKSARSDIDEPPIGSEAREPRSDPEPKAPNSTSAAPSKRDPPPCVVQLFGQCLMYKDAAQPTSESTGGDKTTYGAKKDTSSASPFAEPMRAGVRIVQADEKENAQGPDSKPSANGGDQSDDLLNPTPDELRAMSDHEKDSGKAADKGAAPSAEADAQKSAPDAPGQTAAPVISIQSDVEPESWAEYGGWYRQDYAILYRPVGHKDKFIYAWLFLTGPRAAKGDASPAAAVFDVLTAKDAQGACVKCHSVDSGPAGVRIVNFSPASLESKKGSFTRFVHEPHFGVLESRGCLTCHELAKDRPYLKGYEHGDAQNFVSNFGEVKKDLCQTCHTSGAARQDCLLCHEYHVNGVATPMMSTRIPSP